MTAITLMTLLLVVLFCGAFVYWLLLPVAGRAAMAPMIVAGLGILFLDVLLVSGLQLAADPNAAPPTKDVEEILADDPDPIMRVGVDGVVKFTNAAGRVLLESWDPETAKQVPPAILDVPESNFEIDGRFYHLVVRPKDSHGLFTIYGQDQTESHRTQAKLENALNGKEFLEEVLDSMSDMLILVGNDGKIGRINQVVIDNFGHDSVQDCLVGDIIVNANGEHDPGLINLIMTGPLFIRDFEAGFKTHSGRVMSVLLSTSTVGRLNKETGFIVCLIKDITDMKKALNDKEHMQLQLVQASKLASLGTLGAGVAHELNNPLVGVKGFAQMIQQNRMATREIREQSGRIVHAANRMQKIINHLRIFTRQSEEADWRAINVNKPIEDSLILMQQQLLHQKIAIKLELDADLPAINGDHNQLESVFQNLMSNSRDAFGDVIDGRDNVITFKTALQGGRVEVSYSDNAMGIPEHVVERIFDPFFTTKGVGIGTGLGMSIVHGILEKHKATIRIQTRSGEGTTFFLSFPADLAAVVISDDQEDNDNTESEVPPQRPRVMVIDDEPDVVDILRIYLEGTFDVAAFTEPQEALVELAREHFDLVITDVRMPLMGGIEVMMKAHAMQPTLPVILCTGHAITEEDMREGRRKGAVGILCKPFGSPLNVVAFIEAHVPQLKAYITELRGAPVAPGATATAVNKPRLLIVDDEPEVADVLATFLEDHFNTVSVGTAALACAAISKEQFDCVVTDINLPDGSGIDVVLETKERLPNCRIVISTGLGRDDPRVVEALRLGADAVLIKPFSSAHAVFNIVRPLKKAS